MAEPSQIGNKFMIRHTDAGSEAGSRGSRRQTWKLRL
jgi:hypothetical protein